MIIKGIRGIPFYGNYEEGLRELIKFLKEEESEDHRELLSRIESFDSPNPFRRVRAEFFRDNYELLAKAFAEPEKEIYDLIQEEKSIFIMGGRGCGKTMILKSLTPEVLIYRLGAKNYGELKKKGITFFGIYFRLEKGCLLLYDYNNIVELGFLRMNRPIDYRLYKDLLGKLENIRGLPSENIEKDPIISAGLNAVWTITLNELNLKILKNVLKELKRLSSTNPRIIDLDEAAEEKIVREISEKLQIEEKITDFRSLIRFIDKELIKITNYIQDLSVPYAKPTVNWVRTGKDFLDELFDIISANVQELNGVTFYLLLDEFENLLPVQQTIIMEWIKTSKNFVVKVASKFEGIYATRTLEGQSLQFGQDCPHPIILDYDLFDDTKKSAYQNLLIRVCSNLLKIEGYRENDIRKLLEEPEEPELPQKLIDEEIRNTRLKAGLEFSEEKIKQYREKLQIAAIFRLLRNKRKIEGRKSKKKIYAGFETYTYLSSGIIRIFLNLVGMALYKAEENETNVKEGEKISVECQTWAAYVVSKAWLEKIPDNYDLKGHGEKIYNFIVDIGDILRERLLFHPTEPECLSITIKDPSNLTMPSNSVLNDILFYATRESILYQRRETSSYKPRQPGKTREREYILNRIYTPILELSYRARWGRNMFTVSELGGLLDEKKRNETKKKLINRVRKIEGRNLSLIGYVSGDENE